MKASSVAAILLLVVTGATGAAADEEAQQCLGPAIGHTLEALVQAHAFQGVVPSGFRLERLDASRDHVEMGYDDDTGPAVTVLLTLPGAEPGPPVVARGPNFEHRIADEHGRASGPAREVMLRAAMIVDRAIPAAALQCAGTRDGEKRAPASFDLGVGAAEAAIVIAALALAVARRPPSKSA